MKKLSILNEEAKATKFSVQSNSVNFISASDLKKFSLKIYS